MTGFKYLPGKRAGPSQTAPAGPAATLKPPHLPAVLALGAVSQIGQVLFLRELLMVFHGNELSIGLILAAWLTWVGLGSHLGAALVSRTGHPAILFTLSTAGLLLVLPATILLARGLRSFFTVLPGAYLSLLDMTVSCFALLAPACLLLGTQFVLLSRVWRENDRAKDTAGASKTYIGEAAGNMLGGLVFTFLLVRCLNALQTAVLAGMLMLAAALLMARKNDPAGSMHARLRPALWTLLLTAAITFPFLDYVDQWAYRIQWRYFTPQLHLAETHHSKYGTIAVLQGDGQYTFYQSGHLVFSTAGPGEEVRGLEEQDAVAFAHLAMVQHTRPESVLLIGGGLRGTLSEIIRHPVEKIDYIEMDEALTAAARPYLPAATLEALADPRVRLVHGDGRLFVKTSKEKYDLIIVDLPDPATAVLNRYYTREFFREAAALLNPGGVLVTGAVSTPDLRSTAVANRNATIYHTLDSVFTRVLLAGERLVFYIATDEPGQVSVEAATLEERYKARAIEAEGFAAGHFYTLLEPEQVRRVNWILQNHGRSRGAHLSGPEPAPFLPHLLAEQDCAAQQLPPVEQRYFINSDFKPIGYYYTLMFFDELTRSGSGRPFHRLLRVQPWWVLTLCCLPLCTVLFLQVAAKKDGHASTAPSRFAVLFAVFTTGFSTMALQIALLFSFQSIYGFVYETVGLIVAIFMGGLALGALITHRRVADKTALNILAGVQLLIALLAACIAVVLPRAAAIQSPAAVFIFFSILTFVAGAINGVDFPLSTACYMSLRRHADQSAGIVYGVELFGACAGAAVASVVVAPMMGILTSCLLAGAANAAAFVVLLIPLFGRYRHA